MKSAITDLEQQITSLQSQLNGLRKQEDKRQKRLAQLTARRDRLTRVLSEIEAEIQAQQGSPQTPAAATELPTVPESFSADDQPKLADLILDILRRAGGALTSREISDEALKRGYQSKSGHFQKMVENRIQMLKSDKLVQRSADTKGYQLAGVAKRGRPRKQAAENATTVSPPNMTFPELLTSILRRSRVPLTANDLAKRALKLGWQTSSKSLKDVVWVTLGKMDNVARVKRGGYVLKSKLDRFNTTDAQPAADITTEPSES